jgi:predicted amidophosphoribosyltransferase
MSTDKTLYCPQHGYPLPCEKCGLKNYEACSICGNPVEVRGKTTHYYYCPECKKPVDIGQSHS